MIQQFHFWHMYQKDMKWLSQKDMCTSKLIAVLFIMAKIWKQPKCSLIDEWMNKMYVYDTHIYMYTYTLKWLRMYIGICIMAYYLAIKKKAILPFVTTLVGLEGIMLSDMSDRERQILHFTYMCACVLSCVWLFATLWKAAHQAPLSR